MGTGRGKFDVPDCITAEGLKRKTLLVDSYDNIAASTTYPGMLAAVRQTVLKVPIY